MRANEAQIKRPSDLKSLCLTCKALRGTSTELLYCNAKLEVWDMPVPWLQALTAPSNPGLRHIRRLTFLGKPHHLPDLDHANEAEYWSDVYTCVLHIITAIPEDQLVSVRYVSYRAVVAMTLLCVDSGHSCKLAHGAPFDLIQTIVKRQRKLQVFKVVPHARTLIEKDTVLSSTGFAQLRSVQSVPLFYNRALEEQALSVQDRNLPGLPGPSALFNGCMKRRIQYGRMLQSHSQHVRQLTLHAASEAEARWDHDPQSSATQFIQSLLPSLELPKVLKLRRLELLNLNILPPLPSKASPLDLREPENRSLFWSGRLPPALDSANDCVYAKVKASVLLPVRCQ